jgi:hypothetical protein
MDFTYSIRMPGGRIESGCSKKGFLLQCLHQFDTGREFKIVDPITSKYHSAQGGVWMPTVRDELQRLYPEEVESRMQLKTLLEDCPLVWYVQRLGEGMELVSDSQLLLALDKFQLSVSLNHDDPERQARFLDVTKSAGSNLMAIKVVNFANGKFAVRPISLNDEWTHRYFTSQLKSVMADATISKLLLKDNEMNRVEAIACEASNDRSIAGVLPAKVENGARDLAGYLLDKGHWKELGHMSRMMVSLSRGMMKNEVRSY